MKWLLALVLTLLGVAPTPLPTPTPTDAVPTPTVTDSNVKTITYRDETFAYDYISVANPADVSLIANFSHPKDVAALMEEHNCKAAINGGFYDKNNKPLGYFASDKHVVGASIESALVNGYLWAGVDSPAVISTALPRMEFAFALQSGPVLLFNGETLPLSINNDAHARRMVAAKNNELLFITVYDEQSVYEGPLLGDLPAIIKAISEKEHLDIEDAVNLDGGSASAFLNGTTKLSELAPVGSLFCVNK